jgi:hypothetical protein
MISEGFKKQLITNAYNTQLLPVMEDKVDSFYIEANKRIKNWLLFKKNEFLWVNYKDNYNTIEIDIHRFLTFLIQPIFSIYYYKIYTDFHKRISANIKNILENKRDIDNRLDYAKYLVDIYD